MAWNDPPPSPEEMLSAPESSTWDDESVPLEARGVRLSWLKELLESITWHANAPRREALEKASQAEYQRRASERLFYDIPWPDPVHVPDEIAYTTREFVEQYVLPKTAAIKGPLYALVPSHHRGTPGAFISHSWSSYLYVYGHKFGILDAIDGRGIAGVKEEFVWIDIVSHNQHSDLQVVPDMERVIGIIQKVAFPITPIPQFDRIWCLWELLCAAKVQAKTQFCAAAGFRTDKRIMVNDFIRAFRSVKDAKATIKADYDAIIREIVAHFGSEDRADSYIRELLDQGLSDSWFEKYKE
jgi:hypothetical protein